MTQKNTVSLKEYADAINPRLNRRGHRMSESYLYRLIRLDRQGKLHFPLWFSYELVGDKDKVRIVV